MRSTRRAINARRKLTSYDDGVKSRLWTAAKACYRLCTGLDTLRPFCSIRQRRRIMGYWVYGNDRETGARASFYSDATDEDAARLQAREQGIFVERLEMGFENGPSEADGESEPTPDRQIYAAADSPATPVYRSSSPTAPLTFSGIALGVAELLSVLASGGSLFYLALVLASSGRQPGQAIVAAPLCLLSFFYNAALAIVFSYVRRQLKVQHIDS